MYPTVRTSESKFSDIMSKKKNHVPTNEQNTLGYSLTLHMGAASLSYLTGNKTLMILERIPLGVTD